jgi:preprotein translocase subunit SecG
MGGVQKTTDFLDRSTWILGAVLLVLILLSNVALERGNKTSESKLIEGDNIEEIIPEEILPNNSIPEVKD